jgi:hypothetical protein
MHILLILMIGLTPTIKRRFFDYWGYKPGRIQAQVHYEGSKYRFIAVRGGNRSGKSWLAGFEGAVSAQLPNQSIWLTAPTYDLADKVYRLVREFGVTRIDHCLVADRNNPQEFKTSFNTHVWAKSWEKLQSLEGEGVNKMISDEWGFANKIVWQRLLVRLDQSNSQWIVIFTPKGKNAWIKEWWHERETSDEWLTVAMPTDEMEYVSHEFLEMAERELGGKDSPSYREQIRGEFVMYGLLVYPMFSEQVFGVEKVDRSWRFLIGVDSGYVHPCAAAFWAVSKGDRCYKFGEYHKQYLTRAENAQNIIAMAGDFQKRFKIKFDGLVYDPSDPSFGKDIKKIARSVNILGGGSNVYAADNDVDKGIELMRSLLPSQITINPQCKHTIFDYQNYSHKENSETIQKLYDDHCDCDRYTLLAHFGRALGRRYYRAY